MFQQLHSLSLSGQSNFRSQVKARQLSSFFFSLFFFFFFFLILYLPLRPPPPPSPVMVLTCGKYLHLKPLKSQRYLAVTKESMNSKQKLLSYYFNNPFQNLHNTYLKSRLAFFQGM